MMLRKVNIIYYFFKDFAGYAEYIFVRKQRDTVYEFKC